MESADVEKAWRCVLQHDVVELASFCAAASSSRTLLRCASDAEVDTLRWRPEFQRRFPWLSSTESRTLSVARSAQIWQGEGCKFSTCWRRTYLGVVQSWPRAISQRRDASLRLAAIFHQVNVSRNSAYFDAASRAIELGGAFPHGDSNQFMRYALENDVCYDEDPATARFLFVSTVLASNQAPLWDREAPPDPALLENPDYETQAQRTSELNVLTRCARNLCVRSARAVLASRQFLRSTAAFQRAAVSAAVVAYLESSRGIYATTLAPKMLLLEDQAASVGVGFVGVLRGQKKIDWIRGVGGRKYRARYFSVYRRGEAMGEILRGVAAANDIAAIDEHLALLRMAIGNLERYPPLESDSDDSD